MLSRIVEQLRKNAVALEAVPAFRAQAIETSNLVRDIEASMRERGVGSQDELYLEIEPVKIHGQGRDLRVEIGGREEKRVSRIAIDIGPNGVPAVTVSYLPEFNSELRFEAKAEIDRIEAAAIPRRMLAR